MSRIQLSELLGLMKQKYLEVHNLLKVYFYGLFYFGRNSPVPKFDPFYQYSILSSFSIHSSKKTLLLLLRGDISDKQPSLSLRFQFQFIVDKRVVEPDVFGICLVYIYILSNHCPNRYFSSTWDMVRKESVNLVTAQVKSSQFEAAARIALTSA